MTEETHHPKKGQRGFQKKTFITYEQAREIVRKKQFTSKTEFKQWMTSSERKAIEGFPFFYEKEYAEKFNWEDFIGPTLVSVKDGRCKPITYEAYHNYVKTLKICSEQEWFAFVKSGKLPEELPTRPDIYFKRQKCWPGWIKFLNAVENRKERKRLQPNSIAIDDSPIETNKNDEQEKDNRLKKLPFNVFRENVRRLLLNSADEYRDWCKSNVMRNKGYPLYPEKIYSVSKQWTSWNDVLGIFDDEHSHSVPKCSYIDAKKFAQSLNLSSDSEWRKFWYDHPTHRPDIPRYPDIAYKQFWEGWKKFLGVGLINRLDERLYTGKILWIAQTSKKVQNVYEIQIEPNGANAVYGTIMLENPDYKLVAMFKYEDIINENINTQEYVKRLVDSYTDGQHPLYEGVIIDKIWDLISDLRTIFEVMPIEPPRHITQHQDSNFRSIINDDTNNKEDWGSRPGIGLL